MDPRGGDSTPGGVASGSSPRGFRFLDEGDHEDDRPGTSTSTRWSARLHLTGPSCSARASSLDPPSGRSLLVARPARHLGAGGRRQRDLDGDGVTDLAVGWYEPNDDVVELYRAALSAEPPSTTPTDTTSSREAGRSRFLEYSSRRSPPPFPSVSVSGCAALPPLQRPWKRDELYPRGHTDPAEAGIRIDLGVVG